MRVFVTGASGFVGSAITNDLLQAGHQVTGLARTDSAAEKLLQAGASVHRGDLDDLDSIKAGVAGCDAVIHTAFNHDFTQYKANCENDRRVILALGAALAGSGRPLVVTSGVGLLSAGRQVVETDVPASADKVARAASEEAANAVAAMGVKTYIVRLPPTVHGEGDHGFVPMVMDIARAKGRSVYVGDGQNRWPAVHRRDVATMYRLIVEQVPEQRVFHAVAEEGIAFRQIATAIGNGLKLETISVDVTEAEAHFGWFAHFAGIDCPASSDESRKTLGWVPNGPELMDDLVVGVYF